MPGAVSTAMRTTECGRAGPAKAAFPGKRGKQTRTNAPGRPRGRSKLPAKRKKRAGRVPERARRKAQPRNRKQIAFPEVVMGWDVAASLPPARPERDD